METGKKGIVPDSLSFMDWNSSITGDWDIESGLHELRDLSVNDLSDDLWNGDDYYVTNSALLELIGHGNPRKAAAVAQDIVRKHGEAKEYILQGLGNDIGNRLLESNPQDLPSSPKEYPKHIKVTMVQ